MLIGIPFWLAALGGIRLIPLTGVATAFVGPEFTLAELLRPAIRAAADGTVIATLGETSVMANVTFAKEPKPLSPSSCTERSSSSNDAETELVGRVKKPMKRLGCSRQITAMASLATRAIATASSRSNRSAPGAGMVNT